MMYPTPEMKVWLQEHGKSDLQECSWDELVELWRKVKEATHATE